MLVTVTYPFFLRKGGHIHRVGETVEVTPAKARELTRRRLAVPADATESAPEAPAEGTDYAALTNAALRDLCAGRGISAPSKANKAQLIALLEGGQA